MRCRDAFAWRALVSLLLIDVKTRDAEPEPEPEPEPPEPTHFGRSRSRSWSRRNGLPGAGAEAGAVKKQGGSGSEKGYSCWKIT